MYRKVEIEFHGRPLSMEVGRLAKQADGAALVTYGETVVFVTAVAAESTREGIDFLPLTCDYQERTFAAGKIPGGFFKREGRPSEKETLTSRLIDRPIRPLFPEGFSLETQIIATVLSHDRENDPDMVSLIGTSAALQVSDIPFHGPMAAVRMGWIDGQLVVNPTQTQIEQTALNLVVAGTRDGIVMVEGGAKMLPEDIMLDALFTAHRELQVILDMQDELRRAVGKPKREITSAPFDTALFGRVDELLRPRVEAAFQLSGKQERATALHQAEEEVVAALTPEFPDRAQAVRHLCEEVTSRVMRGAIVTEGRRVDGRGLKEVRPITCEVGVLPRTHGSALFTRGETQALAVATLGTSSDEQKIDALIGEYYKRFMLHYNFPPFSVGEVKFLRSPGRREIGHGALAERALQAVLPSEEEFPYTIRVVSEILESNGSSSMATVCGTSLALMDAGVPLKRPTAGIAMGLILEDQRYAVLSDILGDEDHLGDMDFKVAGTERGVTSLQMDIKIAGITEEIMQVALGQAKDGRMHILNEMSKAITQHRAELGEHAPRIEIMQIPVDKIREVIGSGGKVIREIVEKTGAKIDIQDDGTIKIASAKAESIKAAINWIKSIASEPEVGHIYDGTVVKVMDFGAFVNFFGAKDGLVHISQLAPRRVQKTTDVVKEGDKVKVKLLGFDERGKVRLSMKAVDQATGEDLEAKQKAEGGEGQAAAAGE